jgi:YegS/Rv2252/BmrU family lipid kinase
MNKKMLFIFNPHAGKGIIRTKLLSLLDYFTAQGYDVTAYPTQASQDALTKTREEGNSYDLLVCSGGDGTLDEVVTGMLLGGIQTPLGYIPAGTTNDFAQSLGIPKTVLKAAHTAVEGRIFACDMGSFNRNYFVYIAAFGAFTEVAYQTNQQIKNVLGHLAYVLEGAKRLHLIKSYEMEVEADGELYRDFFIYGMVTNSISVGGYKNIMGKDVKMDDGLFEVTLIRKPKSVIDLQAILAGLASGDLKGKNFLSFKARKIKFYSEELIPWTLDGEFGGEHCEVKIENHEKALEIMT